MVFTEKPADFHSRFDVVGCFVEHDGKFLILLRQDHKPQGNMWGVPAGKVEPGETIEDAIVRELAEETGHQGGVPIFFKTVYVTYPEYDLTYHMFHVKAAQDLVVTVDPTSHKEYKWVTPDEALATQNLIHDLDSCVKLFYKNE